MNPNLPRAIIILLLATIGAVLLVLSHGLAGHSSVAQPINPVSRGLAFFTMTFGPDLNQEHHCDNSINTLRLPSGEFVLENEFGRGRLSTLRATPGLGIVVAGSYGIWREESFTLRRSIYIMHRNIEADSGWGLARTVIGPDFYYGIDILPDHDTLLVATAAFSQLQGEWIPPFRIETYSLAEMTPLAHINQWEPTHQLGPMSGALDLPSPVVNIHIDPDGRHAHLLTHEASFSGWPDDTQIRLTIHTIDVSAMREVAAPIPLPPWLTGVFTRAMLPMSTISPDGRYIVTTGGTRPEINVVDLVDRRAWSVPIDGGQVVKDVSFSHGTANHGLLALNVSWTPERMETPRPEPWELIRTQTHIGRLDDVRFEPLGRGPISSGDDPSYPSAIEWTASGDQVIAAVSSRRWDSRMDVLAILLDVADAGRTVMKRGDLYPCRQWASVMDILTENGYVPTPTPTPTITPSPTPTLTPPPSATATVPPTLTSSPTTPPPLVPIYLPIAANGHCLPRSRPVDVALVLDTSTSMRRSTASGGVKFTAAIAAAAAFVDALRLDGAGGAGGAGGPGAGPDFDRDRVAVVGFNAAAWTALELSADRAAIHDALAGLEAGIAEGTRLDLALSEGAAALGESAGGGGGSGGGGGGGRDSERQRVLILLTDGLPNNVPTPIAGGSQEDTVIEVAAQAKAAGITLYSIGLGQPDAAEPGDRINRALLLAIASAPSGYLETPDAGGLAAIYAELARAMACE